jgi:hypothetical protein
LSALAIPFSIASSKLLVEVDVISMTLATDMTNLRARDQTVEQHSAFAEVPEIKRERI